MKNTGKPFEVLTTLIFQDILDQTDVNTISVQHNVTLKGKTADHQIDVYWKFELASLTYETVVQAKDWNNSVNQGELLKFKAILDDLPGNPKGVFVTRTGYQSGALDYAEAHGIELYELREPSDADFEGRIRVIHLIIEAHVPRSSDFRIIPDDKWIRDEFERMGLPPGERIPISISGKENEIQLCDENHQPVTTLRKEIDAQFPPEREPMPRTTKTVTYSLPRFIKTSVDRFPWVKVAGFQVDIEIGKVSREIVIKAEDFVGFILRRISDGFIKTFDHEGKEIRKKQ